MAAEKGIKHSTVNVYDFFFSNKTRRTYTNLAVSLGLIIVFLVFALRPTILTVGTIKEKIKEYEQYNEKVEAKIAASQKLQQQLTQTGSESPDGLKDEIDLMNRVFQSEYGVKVLYENFKKRADDYRLVLKSLAPKYTTNYNATSPDYDYSQITPSGLNYELNISVEGKSQDDVLSFINSLEGASNFPIVSRVKAISITDNAAGSKLVPIDATTDPLPQNIMASVSMTIYLDQTIAKPLTQ